METMEATGKFTEEQVRALRELYLELNEAQKELADALDKVNDVKEKLLIFPGNKEQGKPQVKVVIKEIKTPVTDALRCWCPPKKDHVNSYVDRFTRIFY